MKGMVEQGSFALVVWGGSHDLAESVREIAPQYEYIRVTTRRFAAIAGEE